MKTIGLLGGMSWVSTQMYYELLNTLAGRQVPIILKSFDYQALYDLQKAGLHDEVGATLAKGAQDLESIGVDVLAICANTMHKHYDEVQAAVKIPVMHVADACGQAIVDAGYQKATLLGTKYTMEGDFYRKRLSDKFGIETLVPSPEEREEVERIIRNELTKSIVEPASRENYLAILHRLAAQGSQCGILGCTEIGLLLQQSHTDHPLFDTTIIHAEALVAFSVTS